MYYVYEWFKIETGEIIYVGKGTHNRYKVRKHNKLFNEMIEKFECESRIIKEFENENDAFDYENKRIAELWEKGECKCNIRDGGFGGATSWWNESKRKSYSENNVMKSEKQRKRMSKNNPMKNKEIVKKVVAKKQRAVIVKGILFESTKSAGNYFNRHPEQIQTWCKRGYDVDKEPCRYADEEQKQFSLKVTNSKKVVVDNITFNSVRQAAQYYGVWSETIIRAIKNNKPFKGHICRYDNQQPSQGKSDNSTLKGSTTNE